jgi:hypothetical protein
MECMIEMLPKCMSLEYQELSWNRFQFTAFQTDVLSKFIIEPTLTLTPLENPYIMTPLDSF